MRDSAGMQANIARRACETLESGLGNVFPGSGIRVELNLQLGEQEECLLHGIGDQKDMDEFDVRHWRVRFQVLRSDLAHHFAAITGEPPREIPGHLVV